MDLDLKRLNKFIVNAHINGYASSGEGGEKILADGSKELEYKENDFFMRDRYFGSEAFIGEEVIFYKQNPVWGMNYYGKVISKLVSVKEIYSFLKEALKRVTKDKPFRGPNNFEVGNFRYINKTTGSVVEFKGEEKIYCKERLVYKSYYHGGLVGKYNVDR